MRNEHSGIPQHQPRGRPAHVPGDWRDLSQGEPASLLLRFAIFTAYPDPRRRVPASLADASSRDPAELASGSEPGEKADGRMPTREWDSAPPLLQDVTLGKPLSVYLVLSPQMLEKMAVARLLKTHPLLKRLLGVWNTGVREEKTL